MNPRKEHFPRPSFDPHAEAIETVSVDVLLQDPTIGKLERIENRPWVAEADAEYRDKALGLVSPPIPVTRDTAPVELYQIRRSRHVAAWVTGYLFIVVLALLVVAVVVAQ